MDTDKLDAQSQIFPSHNKGSSRAGSQLLPYIVYHVCDPRV